MNLLRTVAPLAVLAFATAACGGIVKPADESPSPAASTAPSATAPAVVPTGPCLATMTTRGRRPGWVDAGKLTMRTVDKKTVSAELRDVVGRQVKRPAIPTDPGEAKTWMAESVCALGGYLLVLDPSTVKAAEKGGTTTLEGAVLRPAQEDEAADLKALCTEPKLDLPADAPPLRHFVAATEEYTESLTSRRWRGWLFTTLGYGPPGARPTKAQQADELEVAAKQAKLESCWFAKTLRDGQKP
jgi:hypothetical protein